MAIQEARVRRRLAAHLQRDGYEVTQAADGSEAVEGLVGDFDELPDVVVADARLPGWNGLEMLSLIWRMGLDVPVVLLVDKGDTDGIRRAEICRASAVLVAPPDWPILRAAVESARSAGESGSAP
jgi:DNA-binding NtrC family response regulator